MRIVFHLVVCVCVAAVASLVFSQPARSEIVAGVQTDQIAPEPSGTPNIIAAPAGATLIDFDDATQPCAFIQTVALRDEYAALGVHFSAPGNDGGAILDECGNFGVTGQSSPNFLAFNTGAPMSDGGIPRTPQTITFDSAISSFQINAGSSDTGNVTVDAFDAADQLVDSNSLALAPGLQTLSVSGPGITRVVIRTDVSTMVLDDMAVGGAPVATMPFWAIGLLIVALIGIASLSLRSLH